MDGKPRVLSRTFAHRTVMHGIQVSDNENKVRRQSNEEGGIKWQLDHSHVIGFQHRISRRTSGARASRVTR
jgi:hypothetical protein